MSEPPDDAAYGRVTRPERYAPVQDFARRLVDDLLRDYDAEVVPGTGVAPAPHETTPTRRVCPRTGGGGCLTFGETPFPGVVLGVGRWHWFHFPRCGCDACDEQVDDLQRNVAALVDAFVDGRFTEYVDARGLGHRWTSRVSASSGWTELGPGDPRRAEAGATIEWPAWPRRP